MPTDNYQLVAFNIPEHLVYYFARKLGNEVELLPDGSYTTETIVRKNSFYGQHIYTNIIENPKPKTIKANFYLKIRNTIRIDYPNLPDARYVGIMLDKEVENFINKHLYHILKTELISYVDGALFSYQREKGITKGITHRAISEFMFKNRILINDSTFENFRKMHYREKKRPKKLIFS
ncbi:hypothetical protein [Winogradskyella pulchriflava]|uniref:Uncharacterized protein n=1 Tax=Winogradskyella pulchriflava TaxID=1110688 RepID=A0ABV6QC85_9FLAO